jgi:membrane fusion protein, macrolide-specific efflux system
MDVIPLTWRKISAGLLFIKNISLFKKIVGVVVLLALLGLIGFQFFSNKTEIPQYQTSKVERGTIISTVTASGTVSSANSASIITSATGVVNQVFVKNGDTVTQGQILAKVSLDQAATQKQAAAYASYLSAQNNLNSAKSKMDSLQAALFEANQKFMQDKGVANPDTADPTYIIERANWLQAESDYNNQQGVIAQTEAALTSASLSYSLTSSTITAPMTGTITNFTLVPGLSIANTSSSSSGSDTSSSSTSTQSYGAITKADGKTQASVSLSEIDVTKVAVDQKATMTLDAFSGKTFTGKVTAINIAGTVSSGVTTYPATIAFDVADKAIYPNMAVSATIITSIKNDVLMVSSTALQQSNGETTVRVLKNNQVTSVSVETGASSDTNTEIVSGLNEGDTVVTGTITQTTTSSSGSSSPFSSLQRGGLGGGTRSGSAR